MKDGDFQNSPSFTAAFRSFPDKKAMLKYLSQNSLLNLVKLSFNYLMEDQELLEFWLEDDYGMILFHSASQTSISFNKDLWKFSEKLSREEVKKLLMHDDFEDNILYYAAKNRDPKVFDFYLKIARQFLTDSEIESLCINRVPMRINSYLKRCLSLYEMNFGVEQLRKPLLDRILFF
jgi:hypothetical protein